MLFIAGIRDLHSHLATLTTMASKLGAKVQVHLVQGGDHTLNVHKGRSNLNKDPGISCGRVGKLVEPDEVELPRADENYTTLLSQRSDDDVLVEVSTRFLKSGLSQAWFRQFMPL